MDPGPAYGKLRCFEELPGLYETPGTRIWQTEQVVNPDRGIYLENGEVVYCYRYETNHKNDVDAWLAGEIERPEELIRTGLVTHFPLPWYSGPVIFFATIGVRYWEFCAIYREGQLVEIMGGYVCTD